MPTTKDLVRFLAEKKKSKENIEFDEGWKFVNFFFRKLEDLLEKSSHKSPYDGTEYMSLYTLVFNMSVQNITNTKDDPTKQKPSNKFKIYDGYIDLLKDYHTSVVLPSLLEKHDEFALKEFLKRWIDHKHIVRWLSNVLDYLNRFNIPSRDLENLNKKGLIYNIKYTTKTREIGLFCFRQYVYHEISPKIRDIIIDLIYQEREGHQIDRALVKNVVSIFVQLELDSEDLKFNFYGKDFEDFMLKETVAYYTQKASKWIQEYSCPEYMLKVEECLKSEKERNSHYLHSKTEEKLLGKTQYRLLSVHSSDIVGNEHSGCHVLLRDDKVDDLSRMYRLFSLVKTGLDPVSQTFQKHVTDEGTTLVNQAEDAATRNKGDRKDAAGSPEHEFVKNVIELHDKYFSYVSNCFQNHVLFHKALKEAFEVFCNKTVAGNSCAEMMATFCDNTLKKGSIENLSDEDIDTTLEKVVKLLAYVSDKDLFAEFCRKKLARRLLLDRSGSEDLEQSFLTKLKQQCGGHFTSKMEGMVTDLVITRENQSNFEGYLKSNPQLNPGIDFTVTVLTTGFWPSYKSSDINIPVEMVKSIKAFTEYYQSKTKHRKLLWVYSLGTSNIIGKFESKNIEMVMSTYQAATLLLFNSSDRLSYSEIKSQLNMMDDDVERLLHSLACGKYKILSKEPDTKIILPTDHFEFNSKFTDKMRRIKIPLPPSDDKKKVIESVNKDRRYTIDAAIVRIMKGRKVLGHQELVMECVQMLNRNFKPDIKLIKKRIEDLISRDFLERDKDNQNIFKYLA